MKRYSLFLCGMVVIATLTTPCTANRVETLTEKSSKKTSIRTYISLAAAGTAACLFAYSRTNNASSSAGSSFTPDRGTVIRPALPPIPASGPSSRPTLSPSLDHRPHRTTLPRGCTPATTNAPSTSLSSCYAAPVVEAEQPRDAAAMVAAMEPLMSSSGALLSSSASDEYISHSNVTLSYATNPLRGTAVDHADEMYVDEISYALNNGWSDLAEVVYCDVKIRNALRISLQRYLKFPLAGAHRPSICDIYGAPDLLTPHPQLRSRL